MIKVGWWAADAANASWGVVHEVPRIGDYIQGVAGEENSYRVVNKVAILPDGNARLRVSAPVPFN